MRVDSPVPIKFDLTSYHHMKLPNFSQFTFFDIYLEANGAFYLIRVMLCKYRMYEIGFGTRNFTSNGLNFTYHEDVYSTTGWVNLLELEPIDKPSFNGTIDIINITNEICKLNMRIKCSRYVERIEYTLNPSNGAGIINASMKAHKIPLRS